MTTNMDDLWGADSIGDETAPETENRSAAWLSHWTGGFRRLPLHPIQSENAVLAVSGKSHLEANLPARRSVQ
jgi:hypothetical protein